MIRRSALLLVLVLLICASPAAQTPSAPKYTITDLGTLGGTFSYGSAINTVGQVTGWAQTSTAQHAFLAIPGSAMLDLNELIPSGSGCELMDGTAIKDKGQITGSGIINGQRHAFLLTPVTTTFSFTGFYQPVDNAPVANAAKAGAAVPVKFALGGDRGLQIFASGYPKSQQMICNGGVYDDIEQTITTGGNTLRF